MGVHEGGLAPPTGLCIDHSVSLVEASTSLDCTVPNFLTVCSPSASLPLCLSASIPWWLLVVVVVVVVVTVVDVHVQSEHGE